MPKSYTSNKGWTKLADGTWVPDKAVEPPKPPTTPAVLGKYDASLEASHARVVKVLAMASRRLEVTAEAGSLTQDDLKDLGELAGIWRTLEANVERLAEKAIDRKIKQELKRLGKTELDTDPTDGD